MTTRTLVIACWVVTCYAMSRLTDHAEHVYWLVLEFAFFAWLLVALVAEVWKAVRQ